ncbi:MAG: TIR domain-containing protein [Chloroflexota bacterium]
MTRIIDIENLLDSTMDWTMQLSGGDRGAIFLLSDDSQVSVHASRNLSDHVQENVQVFSRSLITQVVESGETVLTTTASETPKSASEIIAGLTLRSVMAIPLKTISEMIGIIYVDVPITVGIFGKEDLNRFEIFASIAAVNFERLSQLETRQSEVNAAMAELKRRNEQLQNLLDGLQELQNPTTKPSIFVSYSRTNEDFARRITKSLIELDFDVWLDVEKIPSGANWANTIHEGLTSSEIMLLIMTPDSMKSQNVEHEWQYYMNEVKKPIIPVMWQECQRHFQLTMLQYIDFRMNEVDYEKALIKLERALQNASTLSNL